ncbi:MAG TPA: efflux RND transporter periplasmic adaptor subunit [Stellaceae bacterium]|nr:efflux RND transporter periplasmic adaptor subunit [Stellaceae bacterium]
MKKGIVAAAGLAVLAIVAGAVLPRVVGSSGPATAAEKPHVALPPVPVTAGIVKTADVPVLLSAIGTVQAYNMVTIKSRVDGQIVGVDFKEGDEVRAGTPLFQIDPRPYQAALDQALANEEKDRANLANAELNLARDAKIVANNLAVSQQQFDTDKATVAADQAMVDSDKAQVETARLNLSYCTITSPIDGRLGARLVDIGNLVHASDTGGLVTVAQVRPIFVSFTLPQDDLAEVRSQEAKSQLAVDAFAGDNTTPLGQGRLTLVDNTVDQATGTIHLKAAFPNPQERLWPGQFVNLRVVLGVRKNVPTVPAETVQQGPNGEYAYVINENNTVVRKPVETATVQEGIAVISKGLEPGERVVVDGQFRLFDGARVRLERPHSGASG